MSSLTKLARTITSGQSLSSMSSMLCLPIFTCLLALFRLLAPLVGGTCEGRGERSMSSLAKLARAIASGRVRQHCEQREYRVQVGVTRCSAQPHACQVALRAAGVPSAGGY